LEIAVAKDEPSRSRKARHQEPEHCPVEAALNRIGGKWKGLIILRLLVRTRRFSELLRSLPGCTQRMLTNQLRELEADGIVHREIYPQVPPRVEYSLTETGRELMPVIRAMCEWGQKHVQHVEPDFETVLESAA
jgi:DNA-binding HxlR family transcriptional regulator